MIFSYSKSLSQPQSVVTYVSSSLSYMLAITITILMIQNADRSNYLVEAFAQQKFTGGASISILSQAVHVTSTSSLSSSSLLSTVSSFISSSPKTKSTTTTHITTNVTATATMKTYPDQLLSDVFVVPSVLDDDDVSSIAMDPLPSIVLKCHTQTQEKKKKNLWHHQSNNGLESKLIFAICFYHVIKLVVHIDINIIHLPSLLSH